jgi:Fic family protein
MKRNKTGDFLPISAVEKPYHAFVPHPLPPQPPLQIDAQLQELMDQSLMALGRLDSISILLPEISLLLHMFIRKEAILSSQIEGTQSTLSDLLIFESEQVPGMSAENVQPAYNYVAAMNHGINRLNESSPLSLELLKEVHGLLLMKGPGSDQNPGEFRQSQNWIGGTHPDNALFIPPPPSHLMPCLGELEKFFHNQPEKTPLLIKAALAHVQFESIHPFLDGNGRMGRLLTTLLFCAEGALKKPLLYLSLYFKKHQKQYEDLLQKVRTEGDWEEWVHFFMTGVKETAMDAVETTKKILTVFESDKQKISTLGKRAGSTLQVYQALQRQPILSIPKASEQTGLTVPTVTVAFKNLTKHEVMREITGKKRGRLFIYDQYVKLINEGIN